MIKPSKAWELVCSHTQVLVSVETPVANIKNVTLANEIVADRDLPATNRSAMDGFALRSGCLATGQKEFEVFGEIAAGAAPDVIPPVGQCVRIFTGASVPYELDTVVKIEDTNATGFDTQKVIINKEIKAGANVLRQGEQAKKGETLISKSSVVTPSTIAVAASTGFDKLECGKYPSVSILVTGEELKSGGDSVMPHQIRDSNGPMLQNALNQAGCKKVSLKKAKDDLDAIVRDIEAALDSSQMVLLTGGVSVGSYDFVPEAIVKSGGTVHFHKVAIKPGKPILFATSKDGKPIFGLPGNPISSAVTFYEFVLPCIKLMAGYLKSEAKNSLFLPLKDDFKIKGDRALYVLSKLDVQNGKTVVCPVSNTGSADLVAGAKSRGMTVFPVGAQVIKGGTIVEYRPFGDLV